MSREIREMVRKMSLANPLWGAPRTHGELLKLGIDVSQATVGRYLHGGPRFPPRPGARSCTITCTTLRPHLAFCCETATRHMGRPSVIVSRRWLSKRSSPRRDRHGRMPMSSASSARSAANVSITSSSSMSVTCAVCCRHTFVITTKAGRISRWIRTVQSLGPYSRRLQAPLSPSHKSAVCTIATSVAQRKLFDGTCAAVSPQSVVAACNCLARMP